MLASAAAAILLAVPAAAQPFCGMTQRTLLRNFGNIAFGSEHQATTDDRLARWRVPIRYSVRNEVSVEPAVLSELHAHMRLLQRITGHPVTKAGAGGANFTIILTRLAHYRTRLAAGLSQRNTRLVARLARADCAGIYQRRMDTNEIVQAVAIIPVDHARERGILYHCIVEETTQLMGLPNDSDEADFSLFNDHSKRDDLHCQDLLYLRLLYHPRMKPGMSRRQALRVARKVLPHLGSNR
jgi:hypothetical protein